MGTAHKLTTVTAKDRSLANHRENVRETRALMAEANERVWQEKFAQAFLKFAGERNPEVKAFEAIGFSAHKHRKQPTVYRRKVIDRWMTDPWCIDRIQALMKARSERMGIDTDYVLSQAQRLLMRCMGDEEVTLSKVIGGELVQVEGKKFDPQGAARALELIGKHVDVQAFRERVEVDVGGDLAATLQGALARRRIAGEAQDIEYSDVLDGSLAYQGDDDA